MIRAGELRYKIGIYNLTRTKNEFLEEEITLTLYRTVRADRKSIGGTIKELDGQIAPSETMEFKIRYDFAINEDMVVIFKDTKYRVKYVYHTHEESTHIRCNLSKDENLGV